MSYDDFLERKRERAPATGFEINLADLNPNLFDYQAAVTRWGIGKGNYLGALAVGIGSTVIKAIEFDRYGVGVELKDEYFDIGARYCQDKEDELSVPTLFGLKGI